MGVYLEAVGNSSLLKKLDKRCSFEIDGVQVQFQLAFGIVIG